MSSFAHSWKTGLALAAGAAALGLAAQPAGAADAAMGRAPVLQAVVDCRQISDPTGRLACFDRAAAALDAAEQSGDVVVVDREQVKDAQRAAFGFNFRMPAFLTGGGDTGQAEKMETLETEIVSARQVSGKWVIRLPDGAVWTQTDTTVVPRPPRAGSKVTIRQGAVGGYFLSVDGQTSMRAKRQN